MVPGHRHGGLLRPFAWLAKRAWRRLMRVLQDRTAEGVVDLDGRRFMIDFGHFAWLYADGRRWGGRSGRLVSTLPPDRHELPSPLWLIDVLAGVASATPTGSEEIHGVPCRRFAVTVDVSVASERVPGGVAAPSRDRFEDLLALPLDVWVDAEHLRRVRCRFGTTTETLDLWDFGVRVDQFDWTRLPTFRSPEEAAAGG